MAAKKKKSRCTRYRLRRGLQGGLYYVTKSGNRVYCTKLYEKPYRKRKKT